MKVFQNTVQVLLLSTFFNGFSYCNESQTNYIQYPDLNPFYICDAATELIEP